MCNTFPQIPVSWEQLCATAEDLHAGSKPDKVNPGVKILVVVLILVVTVAPRFLSHAVRCSERRRCDEFGRVLTAKCMYELPNGCRYANSKLSITLFS